MIDSFGPQTVIFYFQNKTKLINFLFQFRNKLFGTTKLNLIIIICDVEVEYLKRLATNRIDRCYIGCRRSFDQSPSFDLVRSFAAFAQDVQTNAGQSRSIRFVLMFLFYFSRSQSSTYTFVLISIIL